MVDLSEQLKESNFYELTVKILRYLKRLITVIKFLLFYEQLRILEIILSLYHLSTQRLVCAFMFLF